MTCPRPLYAFRTVTDRPNRLSFRACSRALWLVLVGVALTGCARGPHVVDSQNRYAIDRSIVEYPNNVALTPYIDGLTAPVAIAFETTEGPYKDSTIIAESGDKPRIYGFRSDGSQFWVWPKRTRIPFIGDQFAIYGPIGGMALHKGKVYVSHRDANGMGVITAFDYEGNHSTVVADLPARGDYSVTDLAIHPRDGRLFFGVGAATNSGVAGLDNWDVGWVEDYPDFADRSYVNLKLNGYRFTTTNPKGGLFGGDDIAVTAPFQAFGASRQLRIPASNIGKPTAAIYSVNLEGGDLQVEAHGIRLPRGLVFNEFGNLYATNNGMELRGTRPVKDDPDALLRVTIGGQVWFGWPDYSTDLQPIGQPRFQPPTQMIMRTGYPELAGIVDREASGLIQPDPRLVYGVFPPLSGAAKMTFVDSNASDVFKPYRGQIIVALSGDRAPFATGGQKLKGPQGFRVCRVNVDRDTADKEQNVADFVFNTQRIPASQQKKPDDYTMERPIDVKFGPDGALYIVDFGEFEMKDGRERIKEKTGRIYRLGKYEAPATKPAVTAMPE